MVRTGATQFLRDIFAWFFCIRIGIVLATREGFHGKSGGIPGTSQQPTYSARTPQAIQRPHRAHKDTHRDPQ